ncbi:hypothetical protein PENNAL_c0359G02072, partial [Penicillium nalgiovense]
GNFCSQENTTTDRVVGYHSVAKVCMIFQILTAPAVPSKQQSPVPSDTDGRRLWAYGSCLDL